MLPYDIPPPRRSRIRVRRPMVFPQTATAKRVDHLDLITTGMTAQKDLAVFAGGD